MRLKNVVKGAGVAVLSLGVLAGCADDGEEENASADEGNGSDEVTNMEEMHRYYTEEELNEWARANGFVSEEDLNAWAEDNGLLDDGDSIGDEQNDMAQADENNMDGQNNDNTEQS